MALTRLSTYINKKNLLIALAIFSIFAAMNRDMNLLYGMFALISSTLLISYLLSRLMVRGIVCSRHMNNRATEDEEFVTTIRVESQRRFPQFMLQIRDYFSAASPEEARQTFLVPKLSYRKAVDFNYKKRCFKRGEYSIGPIKLSSANPLGLFTRSKTVEVYSYLLVYPSTFEIDYLPLVGGALVHRIGIETMAKAGTSNDFFGTREYKPGDPIKYIHWPSSARLEKIVVKEFELTAATDVTIMIDLEIDSNIGRGKESTLEYAVKIAASIAKYAITRANSVQFIAYGEDQIVIPSAQGIEQFARILEELAKIKANGRIPFYQAIANANHYIQEGATLVLIFSVVDLEALDSIALFLQKHIKILAVVLNDASFRDDPTGHLAREDYIEKHTRFIQELMAQGVTVYSVCKGDDLSRRLEVSLN